MSQIILPAVWLILFLVGLPQLSETVYTPALPEIALALNVAQSLVEYTLTIYLFGFALGTLFWGRLSDRFGRKPCILAGLFIFMVGCIGCYCAGSINWLLSSRFIQAFGGSIGSVLGQAVCRDSFHGPALGKVYAAIASALAIYPAVGPVIGGVISEHFGWPSIFLLLIVFAILLSVTVSVLLPETHHADNRQAVQIKKVIACLLRDKRVIGLGLIVGGCNGLSFSYYAEGSFYLIKLLGLSPSQYGLGFIPIALSTVSGGLLSRKLHGKFTSQKIMDCGLLIILAGSGVFSALILLSNLVTFSNTMLIITTIGTQMIMMFGVCMATSNALAVALVDYKWCVGTASSLFGFFYYCIVSLLTLGMGLLHNGTLLPMPLYFLAISGFMVLVSKKLGSVAMSTILAKPG